MGLAEALRAGALKLVSRSRLAHSAHFCAHQYWPTWLGLGALWLSSRVPTPVRRFVGRRLGELVYAASATRRSIAWTNLRLCFPELSRRGRTMLMREHARVLGQTACDYAVLWFGSQSKLTDWLEISGEQYLAPGGENGPGLICLSGHSTAFEFGPVALGGRYSGMGQYKPLNNRLLDRLVLKSRRRFGTPISKERGLLPLVRALRRGQRFLYFPDEDLGLGRSVFAPFFGVSKATISGVGRLATLANAPVVPLMTFFNRETQTYEVVVHPPLEEFPTGDPSVDAAQMNQALEALIRRHPAQYMWFLRIFRTRPAGEPPVYAHAH